MKAIPNFPEVQKRLHKLSDMFLLPPEHTDIDIWYSGFSCSVQVRIFYKYECCPPNATDDEMIQNHRFHRQIEQSVYLGDDDNVELLDQCISDCEKVLITIARKNEQEEARDSKKENA